MPALGLQRAERSVVRRHPVPTVVQKRAVGRRIQIGGGQIFARADVVLVIVGDLGAIRGVVGVIENRDARGRNVRKQRAADEQGAENRRRVFRRRLPDKLSGEQRHKEGREQQQPPRELHRPAQGLEIRPREQLGRHQQEEHREVQKNEQILFVVDARDVAHERGQHHEEGHPQPVGNPEAEGGRLVIEPRVEIEHRRPPRQRPLGQRAVIGRARAVGGEEGPARHLLEHREQERGRQHREHEHRAPDIQQPARLFDDAPEIAEEKHRAQQHCGEGRKHMRDQQEGQPDRQAEPLLLIAAENRPKPEKDQRHEGERRHFPDGGAGVGVDGEVARKAVGHGRRERAPVVAERRFGAEEGNQQGHHGDEHNVQLVRRHHADAGRDEPGGEIQQPVAVKHAARIADASVNRVVDARGDVSGFDLGRKRLDAVEMKEDVMPLGHRHQRQRQNAERKQQRRKQIQPAVPVQVRRQPAGGRRLP